MNDGRVILNISVPTAIGKQIDILAKKENKTRSELIREAFRIYRFQSSWARIRTLGEQTAQRMGLESYDDIEKTAG